MDNTGFYNLGYINKLIGNKGDISFILDTDDPAAYAELPMVFINIKETFVPFQIKKIKIQGQKAQTHLEDINDVKTASNLIGKTIHLPMEFLPKLSDNQFYYHEIIGFEVEDLIFGKVGKIKEVIDSGSQAIFQIMHDDKEVLIPISDNIIKKVDRKTKLIKIEAPEGLIQLYLDD